MSKSTILLLLILSPITYAQTYNVNVYEHKGIDTSVITNSSQTYDYNKSVNDGFSLGQKIKAAREKKQLNAKQEGFQVELLSITNNMTNITADKLSYMLTKYPEFSDQIEKISKMNGID